VASVVHAIIFQEKQRPNCFALTKVLRTMSPSLGIQVPLREMLTLHSLYIVSPTVAVGELCIVPPGAVECKAYCTHPSSCSTVEQIWCHKVLAGCWLPLSVSSGLGSFPLSLLISCDVFNRTDGGGVWSVLAVIVHWLTSTCAI